MRRGIPLWLSILVAAACGGSSGGDPSTFGIPQRVIVQGLTFPTGQPQPAQLSEVDAFPGLPNFDRPLFITHAGDGTNRLFVATQGGDIYVFPNRGDVTGADRRLFLSISVSRATNEEGLLGLAFDPDYANNRRFYVYYSLANPRRSRVARYEADPTDQNVALTAETTLLEFDQPFGNHNGGCLQFGPDDKLYITSGDGGSGGDPQNNAQNLGNLLGKVLRINTDGSQPTDNPFFTQQGEPESYIWAYGLRNPWRMSFDRGTGRLWLGDVGQGAFEEIDVIVRGGNYGWRLFEGDAIFDNPQGLPASMFIGPVTAYGRGLGQSVTGGVVYRGALLPTLQGVYVYGDFASGRLWGLVYDANTGNVVSNEELLRMGSIASFGEDQAGEVYVCSFDGNIYRFEETGGGGGEVPATLSASGLFTNLNSLTPAPGVIEYEINAPFWSDGALKRRWIAVPGTLQIGFSATGPWTFPTGTVIVKHFEIELPNGAMRRLETRVLVNAEQGWQGYTYRWNAQGTDANLLDDAETETITVADGQGTATFDWYYPSRTDCFRCHTQAAGLVLGVRTEQLNRDFDYPALTDNQLRAFNHIDLFAVDIGGTAQYGAMADPADTTAPVAARARAYLATNCAPCHVENGPTSVNIDFRHTLALNQTNTVDVAPTTGLSQIPGSLRIDTGSPQTSVVTELIRRLNAGAMPPLGRNRVDDAGATLVELWIAAGPN
ncbi:MAG: PQQ-dependent sugar dehydrogenase [Planctomycetota bacterium]|nr:PQQ-dependent sugar dehydrogenase [Planctomycetota bacterium]